MREPLAYQHRSWRPDREAPQRRDFAWQGGGAASMSGAHLAMPHYACPTMSCLTVPALPCHGRST